MKSCTKILLYLSLACSLVFLCSGALQYVRVCNEQGCGYYPVETFPVSISDTIAPAENPNAEISKETEVNPPVPAMFRGASTACWGSTPGSYTIVAAPTWGVPRQMLSYSFGNSSYGSGSSVTYSHSSMTTWGSAPVRRPFGFFRPFANFRARRYGGCS